MRGGGVLARGLYRQPPARGVESPPTPGPPSVCAQRLFGAAPHGPHRPPVPLQLENAPVKGIGIDEEQSRIRRKTDKPKAKSTAASEVRRPLPRSLSHDHLRENRCARALSFSAWRLPTALPQAGHGPRCARGRNGLVGGDSAVLFWLKC